VRVVNQTTKWTPRLIQPANLLLQSLAILSLTSVRRFGGISFPCPKFALAELGQVFSPAPPRDMIAPHVADPNS
jgi:hypothetical protein